MTWKRIAPLDRFPAGRGVRVDVEGHRIAVFRVDDDLYAVGDRCSHAEAALSEGMLWGTSVECPRHGAEFDLATGRALSLPASRPIPTYPTRVDDDVLFLELPEESP